MRSTEISITAGAGTLERDAPGVVLKIQTDVLELNVWIPEEEVSLLNQVQSASWDARRSVRIGRSANCLCSGLSTETTLDILVGPDDETWDFSLRIPRSALQKILSEIEAEQTAARDRVKKRGA